METQYQKLFYNTVLSQAISSCGEYLFVGNNFGEVFVYRLVTENCIRFYSLSGNPLSIIYLIISISQYNTDLCHSRRAHI